MTYEIKRTIVETYEVDANSKKEALQLIGDKGNPSSITIIKETVKKRTNGQQDKD